MQLQKEKTGQPGGRRLFFDRILLTGFRATGKSMVGRLLADRLAFDFLDTDALLCRLIGCSVADFVTEHGWDRFREQEKHVLMDLCRRTGVIIATGGGAILHDREWAALRSRSASVWLQADERTIRQRLAADVHSEHQRPSLTGMDPVLEIEGMLSERIPLYRRGSDFAVRTDGRSPGELVREVEHGLALLPEK